MNFLKNLDFKQVALWSTLAILGLLLVIQWTEDFKESSEMADHSIEANYPGFSSLPEPIKSPSMMEPSRVVSDFPSAPMMEKNSNHNSAQDSDLPQVIRTVEMPLFEDSMKSKADYNFIRVRTDVVDVVINPIGGDIERIDLLKYPNAKETPDIPFTLLENSNGRLYIAQSGLVGPSGPDASRDGRPHYVADSNQYFMADGDEQIEVSLRVSIDGVDYEKRFVFKRDSYLIDVEHVIHNRSDETWTGNLFAQIKRDNSEGPGAAGMGMQPFLGAAYWTEEKPYNKVDIDDFEEDSVKQKTKGGWLALVQHYFVGAWIPAPGQDYLYETRVSGGKNIISLTAGSTVVAPLESTTIKSQFYAGPKILEVLEKISPDLDLTIDFGWLWFIAKSLFWCLDFIHDYVQNWGWSIILLTCAIKLALFPLSAKSYTSMANMRRIQPEMTRLKDLYGDDRQKMSQEVMQLYRKEKVNPLGGCLPILVQMPIFISLYWALMESVELRQAEFMFWIVDLSQMDPYFILPIIMGASMIVQQRLNPAPADPMQAKVMQMMPIMFTFFFLFFPSGLVLYWVVNNLLSIVQQTVITKRIEAQAAA
ncbi:MAG: membrane protein insertase YidC [Gammaproteobacteria bacterium]|nr:MAG: membrane protein insertase YidC [Gammaproteobacteria bacterium]